MSKNTFSISVIVLLFCLISGISTKSQEIRAVNQINPVTSDKLVKRNFSQDAVRSGQDHNSAEKVNYPRAATTEWQSLATVPGIARRVEFVSETVGYISFESGTVYKTRDGGQSWQVSLDTDSYHEWYGLAARASDVMVVGFNSYAYAGVLGIMRISRDAGETWSDEIPVSKTDWLMNIEFGNRNRGIIVTNPWSVQPDGVFYSFYGGLKLSDWRGITPTASDGWFGNQVSVLPSGRVDISGINYCTSRNFGISWSCRSSVDPVFDGVVFFSDDEHGWVGSGTISPTQSGWVHYTTNGGQTWSGRSLNAPFAIRNIFFMNNRVGWAMGGNYFAGLGGIYSTTNGGVQWTLELETPHEMVSCDDIALANGTKKIWCVGFGRNPSTNSSESKVFLIEK